MLVEFLDHAKSIGAIRRADPIVAENRHVDTGFVLLFEQAVQIEIDLGDFGWNQLWGTR
jgi:hypothetical protein